MSYQKYRELATRKRYSIMKRAFNRKLDMFLHAYFLNNMPLDMNSFNSFSLNNKQLKEYLYLQQLSSGKDKIPNNTILDIDKLNEKYTSWHKNNIDIKTELWKIFQKEFLPIEEFIKIFPYENRKCTYCGISENEIKNLFTKGKITTKRLSTRGRIMEIDQRKPNDGYTIGNMVLCCYWCNNAKTDEYTEEEFKEIANSIKRVWEKRLN